MNSREEEIMRLLWDRGDAMTSIQLEEMLGDAFAGNRTTLFRTIKAMIEKGLIEECGTELHGRQYARKFRPTMTKEEYMARFLIERGVDERSLALVAMAFVRKGDLKDQEDEKLIAELENMIRKLRKRDNI